MAVAAADVHIADRHRCLTVSAHLRSGLCIDEPYGLDLAGILAARVRRATSSGVPDDTTVPDPDDLALPLARVSTEEGWQWMASCALVRDADEDLDPRTFYRREDPLYAAPMVTRPIPAGVQPQTGPWRDMMLPAAVTSCPLVQWHAVGDPDRIAELLRPVRGIGRRRAAGEGRVLRREIAAVDSDEPLRHVFTEDSRITRPCLPAVATMLGLEHRLGWYAMRPPSWSPDRLAELAMS